MEDKPRSQNHVPDIHPIPVPIPPRPLSPVTTNRNEQCSIHKLKELNRFALGDSWRYRTQNNGHPVPTGFFRPLPHYSMLFPAHHNVQPSQFTLKEHGARGGVHGQRKEKGRGQGGWDKQKRCRSVKAN